MKQVYDVVVKSPLGPKKGVFTIEERGDMAEAVLECLGARHYLKGKLLEGGKLSLEGRLSTPIGEEPMRIECQVSEETLEGRLLRRKEDFAIKGTKMQ